MDTPSSKLSVENLHALSVPETPKDNLKVREEVASVSKKQAEAEKERARVQQEQEKWVTTIVFRASLN